jgi:hypothetical protein
MPTHCFVGLDLGTSGCRAVAVDDSGQPIAQAHQPLPPPTHTSEDGVEQSPELWWDAVVRVLRDLGDRLRGRRVAAIGVDGTSGTLLLCSAEGTPLGPALMYNDNRSAAQAARIGSAAPAESPARGASSGLAKLLFLRERLDPPPETLALHQADWIIGRLSGRFGVSDWNNCLKLGYDPQAESWPAWLLRMDLTPVALPRVVAPGTPVGSLDPGVAALTGLGPDALVMAGTTDSTAAVIAVGTTEEGDGVTSLGSTLVVKVVGKTPVWAPAYGVYSHRLGDLWLIGGASNSGGAVLRQYFSDREIRQLTDTLRPEEPTGLDYYPLPGRGERFPVNDPGLAPRLEPRPKDDRRFFQGLLEGIARIEAAGYRRLEALGAPPPRAVATIGGGAKNAGWTRLRERILGVPVLQAAAQEAASGAALLALRGYMAI